MNKPLCEVNNDLITLVVEEGMRTSKIRVWGCFHFGNKENKKISTDILKHGKSNEFLQ